jgi:type IV pilus assembly protein PilY1
MNNSGSDWEYDTFYYVFENNDNAYSDECDSTRASIEDCYAVTDVDWRIYSSDFNVIYYNPEISYTPWAGTGLPNADFHNARSNPQPAVPAVSAVVESESVDAVPAQSSRSAAAGYTVTRDLDGFVYIVWHDGRGYTGNRPRRGNNQNATATSNGEVDLWDNHTIYKVDGSQVLVTHVNYTFGSGGSLIRNTTAGTTITGAAADGIKQNIANWYEFYRRRMFTAKAAISQVVADPGSADFRFGLSVINESDALFAQMPPKVVNRYAGYNSSLLNDLYSYRQNSNGTPLRNGLRLAGRYYSNSLQGSNSYGSHQIVENPIKDSCQQNYAVLFSDGYWNGSHSSTGDSDGDGYSNTVADVAHYYYSRDLQPGLANDVPIPGTRPQQYTYQHMRTFTLAFGVEGGLVDTDNDKLPDQTSSGASFTPLINADWGGNPHDTDTAKIDDLWHAAFNSDGKYIAARNPKQLLRGLQEALNEIGNNRASSAAVATSSGSVSDPDAGLFQALFESGTWVGDVVRFNFNAAGELAESTTWSAAAELADDNYDTDRAIITYNPVSALGVPFRWPGNYLSTNTTTLSSTQVASLLSSSNIPATTSDPLLRAVNQSYGQRMLNYLRGQRDYEENVCSSSVPDPENCNFRDRAYAAGTANIMGDVINSSPVYVPAPGLRIPNDMGAHDAGNETPYKDFKSANAGRTKMVYVGANDGMVHGFNADTGEELLAYVPSKVIANMNKLANPSYVHQYFVDGPATASDAFFNNKWHTVLVGSLGAGGQGIYALDITHPSAANFGEDKASDVVLWEFTDANDADLGYTFGRPTVARMASGDWVAVFGNGYNNTEADGHASTTGHAALYFVSLADGSLLKKVALAENTAQAHVASPNGATTPSVVDLDGDKVADYIYVGDLQGNMWKVDVTATNASNWKVADASGQNNTPLFKASFGGIPQPITSQATVGVGPGGAGVLIYFGTGKYLERFDSQPDGQLTQSFYGVWDDMASPASGTSRAALTPADLRQQTIEAQAGVDGTQFTARRSTDHYVDYATQSGWYVNFELNGDNFGEKMVVKPVLRGDFLIFITWVPGEGGCTGGGSSWLWIVDPFDGSPKPVPPLDLNGDGAHDMDDSSYGSSAEESKDSSWQCADGEACLTDGLMTSPSILSNAGGQNEDPCENKAYTSNSKGEVGTIGEGMSCEPWLGRQSWRQLK